VDVHIVVSDAERAVVSNVRRKQVEADEMSRHIIAHMRDFEREELAS
jgi:ethanolamine ammonia-lyase small subunit